MTLNMKEILSFTEQLSGKIMEHEHTEQLNRELALLRENTVLKGREPTQIIMVAYKSYRFPTYPVKGATYTGGAISTPHKTLMDSFDQLAKDKAQLQMNHQKIRQGIGMLLRPCKTRQDIRDVLPDTLVNLTDLKQLTRTREEAYSIAGSGMLKQQYDKTMELVFMYLGTKLLY